MVGLLVDVHDLLPKLVDIGTNLVSHLSLNIHGKLILVVHNGVPEILMQCGQSVISGDLDLRSVDVQEGIDLHEDLLVQIVDESLQELSLFLDVVGR